MSEVAHDNKKIFKHFRIDEINVEFQRSVRSGHETADLNITTLTELLIF
jgi:hypothetical protein